MELAILVWVISMLTPVTLFLVFTGIGLIGFAGICCMNMSDYSGYSNSNAVKAAAWWKWAKINVTAGILVLGLTIFVPSEKTAWMMTSAWAAQSVVQSDASKKVLKIIETKLDGVLDETLATAQKKVNKEIEGIGSKKEEK